MLLWLPPTPGPLPADLPAGSEADHGRGSGVHSGQVPAHCAWEYSQLSQVHSGALQKEHSRAKHALTCSDTTTSDLASGALQLFANR